MVMLAAIVEIVIDEIVDIIMEDGIIIEVCNKFLFILEHKKIHFFAKDKKICYCSSNWQSYEMYKKIKIENIGHGIFRVPRPLHVLLIPKFQNLFKILARKLSKQQ